MTSTQASAAYAALRQGGAPADRAQLELALPKGAAFQLERLFLNRREPLQPRFARHGLHVAAAMAEGGFPVLPERRR